jgi:hypothetical protein
VTPLKANPKNQRSKFLNQTNMRDKMEKKINKKIAIKRIKTKFNIKMK